MKRIAHFLALLVCVSALSSCGAARSLAGVVGRAAQSAGHLAGM